MGGDEKQVYFGDTHLHTSNSFDAYLMFNRDAGPDTAYRWAKGLPVIHPYTRTRVKIGTPLDFLVIADHAEYLGVMEGIDKGTVEFDELGLWGSVKRRLVALWIKHILGKDDFEYENFVALVPPLKPDDISSTDPVLASSNQSYIANAKLANASATSKRSWDEITEAADRYNDPGNFTAFIGWEWSSLPSGSNLHRVIFSPDSADVARQYRPFSFLDSQYPEDLWQWLEQQSQALGARFIAIPHNSNASKGHMFDLTSLRGKPISDEYARLRLKWEPIVEITQIKGDSETHESLSPNDEFAKFETFYIPEMQNTGSYIPEPGDYVRPALKRGLKIKKTTGFNPYEFGVIGSTDSHTSLASAEEDNFWGKMAVDSIPEYKGSDLVGKNVTGWNMSASGLAAVWAEENTRDAIFAAFQRREVYATTGPRIKVRVIASWAPESTTTTPMGGRLLPSIESLKSRASPHFAVEAMKDPKSASLDRIQMIKGWVDSQGNAHEKIYDLSWSGDRKIDAQGKLEPVNNTVNTETGQYDNSVGSLSLVARWVDPNFDPQLAAFYYVRVLEIPTPRHSLLDSIALNQVPDSRYPLTIQERAYTSSIWYQPISTGSQQ